MAHTEQLIDALKVQLRQRGVTYKQVAEELKLSEASVKRMFSNNQFTLDRVEAICSLVDWDWVDLAEAVKNSGKKIDQLSDEQEAVIAKDFELLMVAVSVINGFSFKDLIDLHKMSETACIQKLAQLDRLKLIELLPGNRIKLKISTNFRWNPQGPIQKYFLDVAAKQFFDTGFSGKEEKLVVVNAMLSDASHQLMQQKMDKFATEMSVAMKNDADLPTKDKKGNTLVIALRHWQFKPFEEYARKNAD